MPRLAFLALLLVSVAGCDTVGSDTSRFVGTWEGRFVQVTTVTSATDQTYAGTEPGVRGVGGIRVRGPVETTLRYFVTAPAPGGVRVEDRGGLDGLGFTFEAQGDQGLLSNNATTPGGRVAYPIPGLSFSADGTTVTVPEVTVATDDGALTIGGTLSGRTMALQAGVPATLPEYERFSNRGVVLTVSADGTYTSGTAGQAPTTGTWEADGDDLILSGESTPLTLDGGALVAAGPADRPVDTRQVESSRRLASGSLTAATETALTVYERAE